MARGKWLLILALVSLAGLVAAAVGLLRRESTRTPAPVEVSARSAPEHVPQPAVISLPARIQAQHVVPIEADVAGSLQEVLAEVGEEVFEGQLLARIGNMMLENARESAGMSAATAQTRVYKLESAIVAGRLEASRARADADRAREDMERADKVRQRQQMLHGEGATPRLVWEKSERDAQSARMEFESLDILARHAEERVESMRAELENARTLLADKLQDLEDAQEHLRAAEVRSPVDGLVVARRGEVGKDFGEDGDRELFRIAVHIALLQAVVEAEPAALERIEIGQEAMLFFADIPGEGIPGTISHIRENEAFIDFITPTPMIKPGMTGQVRFALH
jgi:HlyD family secretion protein